jgi:L-malate glycosyltransferase
MATFLPLHRHADEGICRRHSDEKAEPAVIRVAFVIDTIASPTAGTEKQLLLLLRAFSRTKVEPVLYCLYSSEWLEKEFDICPLVNLGIASFKNIRLPARLWKFKSLLRSRSIDVVQTQFRDSNYAGVLAAKLAGIRAIISTRRGEPYWRSAAELSFLRAFNSAVNVFVANSRASGDFFSARERISPEKMKVIYNGINVADYPTDEETRSAARAQLGIAPKTPTIGIMANLRPVKGIDVFLRAASLVKRQFTDVKFVIAGEGAERNNLTALAGELGIGSDAVFLGRREDVPHLLPALDIGVLSSHFESFSNSIIEYGAAALPVVCTDVGGAREVIVDGETGHLVPAGDAAGLAERLLRLLRNPESKKMGNLARHRVEKVFSINSTARQYEELYLQALDSPQTPHQSKRDNA